MIIQRNTLKILNRWKQDPNRKPLLIRGARQVGKTTLVRDFAKTFSAYIELNLEREADRNLFEADNINNIIAAASLLKNVIPNERSTLLFIDEIQECPKAIKLLRYFYEDRPDLYVIAAGSLLEFSLKEVAAFPVGRIDYLYLHPVNFPEYLKAAGQKAASDILDTIPVPEHFHEILLKLFHEYAWVGGMPGIISKYLQIRNPVFLRDEYNQLWQSYKDDIEKYARNATERKIIRHIIQTAPHEKDRIKFEGFGNSNYRSREVGEAMRALDMAGIIRLIYPTTSLTPPVVTDYKKRPRLQFLDTGLLNQTLNLQAEMITLNNLDHYYQGRIIQHLVTQELISIHDTAEFRPHFWVRESKDSNAEVDLVFHHRDKIIPIEVKAGKQGRLRSLHQFIERAEHPYAVRIYSGHFSIERHKTPGGVPYLLMNIPYYAGTKIPEYIDHFINNYKL